MGPRKFHQQFLFGNFFRIVGVKGEVWEPIFPGAHVGKIIEQKIQAPETSHTQKQKKQQQTSKVG